MKLFRVTACTLIMTSVVPSVGMESKQKREESAPIPIHHKLSTQEKYNYGLFCFTKLSGEQLIGLCAYLLNQNSRINTLRDCCKNNVMHMIFLTQSEKLMQVLEKYGHYVDVSLLSEQNTLKQTPFDLFVVGNRDSGKGDLANFQKLIEDHKIFSSDKQKKKFTQWSIDKQIKEKQACLVKQCLTSKHILCSTPESPESPKDCEN